VLTGPTSTVSVHDAQWNSHNRRQYCFRSIFGGKGEGYMAGIYIAPDKIDHSRKHDVHGCCKGLKPKGRKMPQLLRASE